MCCVQDSTRRHYPLKEVPFNKWVTGLNRWKTYIMLTLAKQSQNNVDFRAKKISKIKRVISQ